MKPSTERPDITLSKRDRRAIKTLTRRAEFLESRAKSRKVSGLDLDKQEAECLRHILKQAYQQ